MHFRIASSAVGRRMELLAAVIIGGAVAVAVASSSVVLNADAAMYFALGRGILNGLQPYADLFESKPPGMFLLSAASLLTTGGLSLAYLVQPAALVGIFLLSYCTLAGVDTEKRGLNLPAWAMAAALTLYIAVSAGDYQTESFGALFACGYVLFCVRFPHVRFRPLVLSLWMAGAILFKEPFALTMLAVAVILARTGGAFLRLYVVPQLLAGVWFAAVLAVLGALKAYVTLYLPVIFGVRVPTEHLLLQGFQLHRLLLDFWQHAPALPILLAGMIAAAAVTAARRDRYPVVTWLRIAVGVYLLTLAAGTAGVFAGNHIVFAIPGFLALGVLTLGRLRETGGLFGSRTRLALTSLAVLAALGTTAVLRNPLARAAEFQQRLNASRPMARRLDAIMDQCQIDRYLHVGSTGDWIYGLSRHSPHGPLFFFELFFVRNERLALSVINNLPEARLVVARRDIDRVPSPEIGGYYEHIFATLKRDFTLSKPDCVREPVVNMGEYIVLFRDE